MINNNILYIKKGNCETIIQTTTGQVVIKKHIDKVFDDWCLNSLTTYKGRLDALKKKYNFKKLVPLYINKDLMLFPVNNQKDVNNIYINCINVIDITKENDNAKIIFKNKSWIIVNKKHQLIKKYYQRCLKVYHLI